jgi:putative molybdopterin biosynthesis protein
VHAAGSHLRDPATGEENIPYVRRELVGRRTLLVTLSRWQQGLIVARGNPKGIAGVDDLLRPDVTIVNRETGSGGRTLLDSRIAAAGGSTELVQGYRRELRSHMAVAEAIAAGLADAGPGIEAAARAFGLDFIPLQDERYDLVIPAEHLETPPMQALLEVCTSRSCRNEVEALGGYDSSPAGTVVVELSA